MKKVQFIICVIGLVLPAVFCATLKTQYHGRIMRGTVLEKKGDSVVLCIGSKDGAENGQTLTAYRFIREKYTSEDDVLAGEEYVRDLQTHFRKEVAGKVQITEILDIHFARARILKGNVLKDHVVELE